LWRDRRPSSPFCRAADCGWVLASAGTTSNTRHSGFDFRGRGSRQEEQIEVLRRFFTDPVVDLTGSFHRIDPVHL
jgi:hypothetical protein